MATLNTILHDGSTIEIEVHGEGPVLLLPVNPKPVEGTQAEQMRMYGADPALGQSLIKGLRDVFRVVAFDYEGQVMRVPKPETLTSENVVADILAVANAAGAEKFAYYGYSWLGMIGLQLAIRTDRLSALVMGGFPPLNGPYKEMLAVTEATYEMAETPKALRKSGEDEWSAVNTSKNQTQQFVTLYRALQGFDDRLIQSQVKCPRLCFVGSEDKIQYGEKWGNVLVELAGPVLKGKAELEQLGWDVRVLEGLDHIKAMQSEQVLPVIKEWVVSRIVG